MSSDFSLLIHIQLKKKIKTPRALAQLEGMYFSEAGEKVLNSLSSLLPSPQFNWANSTVNSEEIWEMLVTRWPSKAT